MKKKIIIGIILVVTAAGLFGYNVYRLNKSIPVELAEAAEGVIRESVYASGKLAPVEESALFVPISGPVERVFVRVGDAVAAGQTLLLMGTEDWEEQIRVEENNREMILAEQRLYRKRALDNAKAELQAGKDAGELLDQDELAMYRLRLEQNAMSLEALRKKLDVRELKAGMDGIVTAVAVEQGQSASQGMPAFTIIRADELKATAFLNELDAGKVKLGMAATVTGDAFEDEFEGKVSYLAAVAAPADQTSRDPSVELWVELEGENEELRAGFNATIEIVVTEQPQILLPLSAVRLRGDQAFVYTVQDGLLVENEVRIGKDDGDRIEIVEGVAAGVRVVAGLTDDLTAGKKVKAE